MVDDLLREDGDQLHIGNQNLRGAHNVCSLANHLKTFHYYQRS